MELKQALNLCGRVAKNATDDRIKYIKIKTVNNRTELMATDSFRIIRVELTSLQRRNFNGFIELESVKNIKTVDDIKLIKVPEYPNIEKTIKDFKFAGYAETESEPLKRFCKIHANKNIILKITIGGIVITYEDNEVKTEAKADITKSNIKYFRTMINSKLLKDILLKDKELKIKVGKSGNDPISFNNQIIQPITIKA